MRKTIRDSRRPIWQDRLAGGTPALPGKEGGVPWIVDIIAKRGFWTQYEYIRVMAEFSSRYETVALKVKGMPNRLET